MSTMIIWNKKKYVQTLTKIKMVCFMVQYGKKRKKASGYLFYKTASEEKL